MSVVKLEINDTVLDLLHNYCKVTDTPENEAVETAIRKMTISYVADNGHPKRAMLKKAGSLMPCYVLGRTRENYYRIVIAGQLMSVPTDHVVFD